MDRDYWIRQTKSEPLFPELEWSKPENRMQAGKLLVVGGSVHGFAAPARAYAESIKAGIGSVRALLPQSIQKIVGIIIENADYAPNTPSGSFSQKALAPLLDDALWADGVLFAGDLGRNSETAIVIEKFLGKSPASVTLTKDAVDYVTSAPHTVLEREATTLVVSLSQLQRLSIAAKMPTPITYSMDLLQLTEWLHNFTAQHAPHIVVKHLDTIFVAVNGQVSTTKHQTNERVWRLTTASHASVWWLQNPSKPFQALTAAVHSVL
jgi:hypothetical protein